MARAGDVIENLITKDRIRFVETAADTNGERLLLELSWPPDGFLAAAHVHPRQSERFEILSGSAWFRIARRRTELEAGGELAIPPGTPHTWGPGPGGVRAAVEFRPALQTEALFETLAAYARAGKLNRRGWPNPLLAAVLAQHWRAEVVGAFPPLFLQRGLCVILAPLGRRLGYTGVHTAG